MVQFAPVVYEHAARFTGKSPWEVSRDARLLTEAHEEAWKEYRHSPVTPGIDIYNLEAEAYGARVARPDADEVPSITDPPLSSVREILELAYFDPAGDGRLPMVTEAARELSARLPGIDVRLPVGGPFSIASNLCGFSTLLMSLFDNPEETGRALMHLARGQAAFARHIAGMGIGISLFESAATPPMLSPDMFRDIELPALRFLLGEVAAATGKPSACIMGGDTAPIAGMLLETGAGFLICPGPGETDQEQFLEAVKSRPDILVRVNMEIGIVVSGSEEELVAECERVHRIASRRRSALAGTGVLPFDAEPERVHRIGRMIEALNRGEQAGTGGENRNV
jgi:hypothetical protein